MTKAEAVEMFKQDVMPYVRQQYESDGIPDYPARSEAWSNFVDMLQRDGEITMRQAETWDQPAITSRSRNPISGHVDWSSRNPFE